MATQSAEVVSKELQQLKEKLAEFNSKKLYEDPEKEKAYRVFQLFDVDNSDDINAKEFQELAFQLGETLTKEEVAQTIKQIDTDNSGTVSFEEFYKWWTTDLDKLKKSRNPEQAKKMKALKAKLQSQTYMKSVSRFIETAQKAAREAAKDKAKLSSAKFGLNVNVGTINKTQSSITISHKTDPKLLEGIVEGDFAGQFSAFISLKDSVSESDAEALVNDAKTILAELNGPDDDNEDEDEDGKKKPQEYKVEVTKVDGLRCIALYYNLKKKRDIEKLQEAIQSLQVKQFSAEIKLNQVLGAEPSTEPLALSVCANLETSRAGAKMITDVFGEISGQKRRRRRGYGYGYGSDNEEVDVFGKLAKLNVNLNFDDLSSILKEGLKFDKKTAKYVTPNLDFDKLGLSQVKPFVGLGVFYLYTLAAEQGMAAMTEIYEKSSKAVQGLHKIRLALLKDTLVEISFTGFTLDSLFVTKDEAEKFYTELKQKAKEAADAPEEKKEDSGSASDYDSY